VLLDVLFSSTFFFQLFALFVGNRCFRVYELARTSEPAITQQEVLTYYSGLLLL
jgi:hypothetical protein